MRPGFSFVLLIYWKKLLLFCVLLIALNEEDRAGLVNALKVSFFFTIWFAYDYLEIGLFIFVTFRDCFLFLTSFEKLIWFLWLREFDFGFEDCLCILIWLFESLWLFLIWFTCLLQNKLQNLAGQHSDVLENLTPPVRKRVEFLREIQNQYDEMEAKFFEERAALEAKYQKLYQPLYTKVWIRSLILRDSYGL